MCGKKMRVCFAVLCLSTVCVLVVGCEGIATKAPTCSVKRLGPYELDEDGFITSWLVVGPFPNPGERPDNEGFHVDYLKEYGGETKYVPADGAEIAKDDGTKLKWCSTNRHIAAESISSPLTILTLVPSRMTSSPILPAGWNVKGI